MVIVFALSAIWPLTRTPAGRSVSARIVSTTTTTEPVPTTTTRPYEPESVLSYPTDCLVGELGKTRLRSVTCDKPHDLEVYREVLIERSFTEFNDAIIESYARDVCLTSFAAQYPDNERYELTYTRPTQDSWDESFRVVRCMLFDPAGPKEGRAR